MKEVLIEVLIEVFNMSISASIVALIVMLIRFPLRKAPKKFSYALWAVVFFRLICQIELESPVSFIQTSAGSIPPSIVTVPIPQIINDTPTIAEPIFIYAEGASPQADIVTSIGANPIHFASLICVTIWLCGSGSIILYAVFGYIRMKRQVFDATIVRNNIFQSDKIPTAFVLGFFCPKIYLPTSVSGSQSKYILEHEQVHIRRRDYLIKPTAFLIVAIHWFNPIAWVSYYLMSMDMEMSCDEAVLRRTNEDIRQVYSVSLVNLYTRKPELLTPLAFGEGSFNSMKMRVKNVVNFKRTSRWATALCFTLLVLFTVGFMTTPSQNAAIKTDSTLITSGYPENEDNQLNAESTVKDITVEIENVVKNDNMLRIHYSIQDEQNRFSKGIYDGSISAYFTVNDLENIRYHSQAFKREDGKYYGTLDVFSLEGLGLADKHIELQIVRISHQLNEQSQKIDLSLFDLNAPIDLNALNLIERIDGFEAWQEQMIRFKTEDLGYGSEYADYYNAFQFLQPDVYNYKLPTEIIDGEVWLSNIGIVNNELRVQIKTPNLNLNSNDGVFATDLHTFIQVQAEEPRYLNNVGEFYISKNGQINFSDSETQQYTITEFALELGQYNINELELYFTPIFQNIINGTWAVSFDAKQFTESITRDLTGAKVMNRDSTGVVPGDSNDMVILEKLTVTPLYYELIFKPEEKPHNFAFFPTVVITYTDGRKTEFVGFDRSYGDADSSIHYGIKFAGDERTRPYELIELDRIQSITLDGTEVFNLNQ